MDFKSLPYANLKGSPSRTVGLALLCALLAFALAGGLLAVSSLRGGLASLQDRLGADIIVAPKQAKSKTSLQDVLLDGVPGQFYMDRSYIDKIAARDGVQAVSPQYYLATAKAGCCSMPVQVIGFDPDTDFSIQPWVARAYSSELGREDVVTGCNISGAAGSTIMFYGVECRIVARLDKTGTALDNAVFATNETLKDLIAGSQKQGLSVLSDNDPDKVISTIQVKVIDGYTVSDVADDINLHVRGATAVQTRTMISGVSDSMAGVSRVVGILAIALIALSIVFLVVAFAVVARSRIREFAILRMVGASRSMLMRMIVIESAVVGALGALVGVAVALVVFYAFGGLIETSLGVPFLAPGIGSAALLCVAVILATVVASTAASAVSSARLSRVDAGYVLREG